MLDDKETLERYIRPTPTPYFTPAKIPNKLIGKIGFVSDLFGSGIRVYVVDPDGSHLALLTSPWPYQSMRNREWISPDGRYVVYQGGSQDRLDLYLKPLNGGPHHRLTFVGTGQAYDPAWSPDGQRIVFASNQEGDDDIFVVTFGDPEHPNPHTEKLTRGDDWQSDKHPSYSPDGTQIVYYSNATGSEQIWIMNADGSNRRPLIELDARCWDPVWFKP
ncbi:MAG: PD40 domain-containing protein [Chloroflexi bacterium]|nr:PD40 domain-containing protein [Chloroflexota bacterium]